MKNDIIILRFVCDTIYYLFFIYLNIYLAYLAIW